MANIDNRNITTNSNNIVNIHDDIHETQVETQIETQIETQVESNPHPDTPRPSPEPQFRMHLTDIEAVVRQTTYNDAEAAEHLADHSGNVLATITSFMGHTYAPKLGEFDKRPKHKMLSGLEIQKEAHRQMRQCHYETYMFSTERAAAKSKELRESKESKEST
jgi:hypothetical protein